MYHPPTAESIRGDTDYADHAGSSSKRTSVKVQSQNTVRGTSQKLSSKLSISKRASVVQGDSSSPSRRKQTSETSGLRGAGAKELKEKCEKLENLLLHSLKVIEKIAIAMDSVPKAI